MEKNQYAVLLGQRGGQATRDKLGREHYQRIAYKSAEVRRKSALDRASKRLETENAHGNTAN